MCGHGGCLRIHDPVQSGSVRVYNAVGCVRAALQHDAASSSMAQSKYSRTKIPRQILLHEHNTQHHGKNMLPDAHCAKKIAERWECLVAHHVNTIAHRPAIATLAAHGVQRCLCRNGANRQSNASEWLTALSASSPATAAGVLSARRIWAAAALGGRVGELAGEELADVDRRVRVSANSAMLSGVVVVKLGSCTGNRVVVGWLHRGVTEACESMLGLVSRNGSDTTTTEGGSVW